ncbi:MAG: hypothetical protein M1839_000731 [Geoglossum umbratile]|nr:MAG: hypothetical protein M1839_000731 [Geoglossum umbratile]
MPPAQKFRKNFHPSNTIAHQLQHHTSAKLLPETISHNLNPAFAYRFKNMPYGTSTSSPTSAPSTTSSTTSSLSAAAPSSFLRSLLEGLASALKDTASLLWCCVSSLPTSSEADEESLDSGSVLEDDIDLRYDTLPPELDPDLFCEPLLVRD